MTLKQQFKEGLITNNPVLVQRIGMCSTMAITTTLFNGIGMGLSVLIILTCCNVAISALRKAIPNDIRLAIFVVVIAGFVTIVDLLLQAFIPALERFAGRLHTAHRRQLHHHRPRRGLLPARADWPELLGRHLPGLRLHRRPRGHVPHPRAPRLRHLRHRHLRDSQRRAARHASTAPPPASASSPSSSARRY